MSNDELPQRSSSRAPWLVALLAIIVVTAGGVAYWLTRPKQDELFKRGLAAVKHDPTASEQLIRQAIEVANGDYPDAQLTLAYLLSSRGRWDEAISVFEATNKTSCRTDLLLQFGRNAIQSKHQSVGVEALGLVRSRNTPEGLPALELLAAHHREFGQLDELVSVTRELAEREPDTPQRWLDLVMLLKLTNQETECLRAVRKALEHNPPPEFRTPLEYVLLDQMIVVGDADGAWQSFEKLIATEGESPQLLAKKIDLYRMNGQMEKALETVALIFPQVQHMPVAYLTRGAIYLDLGRFDEAANDLRRVVAAEPYNEGAQFKLSEAYRGLKDLERSRHHRDLGVSVRQKRTRIIALTTEWRIKPQDARIMNELASLYRDLGQSEEAGTWARRASQAVSNK